LTTSAWRNWADHVRAALAGGHFLMEESPHQLTTLVTPFLMDAFRRQPERGGKLNASQNPHDPL
jgi:surfactin synthase thioesterase subunit